MMRRLLATFLVLAGLVSGAAFADGDSSSSGLYPDVPKAVGAPHPEGNTYMRMNHMRLLKHDRDLTMREGDRSIKYSLKECVACHAQQGPDALPIPINAEGQFCAACHEYAAVKIDCFQCHATKPEEGFTALLNQTPPPSNDEITAYLDGVMK